VALFPEGTKALQCTPKIIKLVKPAKSAGSSNLKSKPSTFATDGLSWLKPVGREKVTIVNGNSEFANAKDSDTPFSWVPASRTFPSLDAVICTDKRIITIQLTVAPKHTMKPMGFDLLKDNLPPGFEEARTWCHVFLTDCDKHAESLRKQSHKFAAENHISIYSAVLKISEFSAEDVKFPIPDRDGDWGEDEGEDVDTGTSGTTEVVAEVEPMNIG